MRGKALAALALTVASALLAGCVGGPGAGATGPSGRDFTFVSIPDLFNNDFADVSGLDGWQPGDPNSMNPAYRAAIGQVFDDVAAESPDAVIVPGDLVQGRWGRDDAGTGTFGPVRTDRQRVAALRRASRTYFGHYVDLWADRGLSVHAAVGDHDIGDNSWNPDRGRWYAWKHENLGEFKDAWAEHFTDSGTRFASRPRGTNFEKTAYSVRLHPEVLLVTVDVFRRTPGGVRAELTGGQLAWLRGVLGDARSQGVGWIIVQGHTPVLGPVRYRRSSHMMYESGRDGAFWRTMTRYGVDLYLSGEVHDNTTIHRSEGPVQISHGGLLRYGEASYVLGRVQGEELHLETKAWNAEVVEQVDNEIWQADTRKTITHDVVYEPGTHVIGSMTMTADGEVRERTGVMKRFRPQPGDRAARR